MQKYLGILLNCLLLPGTGTIANRRWTEGIGQMVIAASGLALTSWAGARSIQAAAQIIEHPTETSGMGASLALATAGLALFCTALGWSCTTSKPRSR